MKFTLIDRITELKEGESVRAIKNLSISEEYLQDHFPNFPVIPGVLMLEAMTQASAWLLRVTEDFAHSIVVLREAANVKYTKFLEPGQQLVVESKILKVSDNLVKFAANGSIEGVPNVSARLTLIRYNLADEKPEKAFVDQKVIEGLKQEFALLYRPT